ncbi:hypothetical protein AB0B83_17205 [Micromonospora sp. NPDC049060]|uniref:hypothetical protein n=1 Tax=Micromonospora sp. NPDC049060 TaxID=3154828 RepID=UPI00340098CC
MLVVALTAPAAVLAFGAIRRRSRELPTAPRFWVRAAGILLLSAAEVYLFGLVYVAVFWSHVRDVCVSRYQNWDSAYGQARYWPLERKCTAHIDMVPGYVNPLIVVLLVATSVAALLALGRAVLSRKLRGAS